MAAKSEPADARARGGVPRWLFETWLWASTLAVCLADLGCPQGRFFEVCVRVGNTAGTVFELFPGVLAIALSKYVGSAPAVMAILVASTMACHLLMRRFLPTRLSLAGAAAFAVTWFVSSFIALAFSAWLAFGRPATFVTFLLSALAELFGRGG